MVNGQSNLLNAFQTTLAAEMSSVASSCTLTSATGLVQTFYLVIEPEDNAQREYMFVSVLAGVVCTVPERYLAGSAAGSGLTHPVGSVVRHIAMSQHFEDLNDRADDLQAQLTALGDHGGLAGLTDDDHSLYTLATGARSFTGVVSGVTPVGVSDLTTKQYVDGEIVDDHGALTGLTDDDHDTGANAYQTAARHDAAHGAMRAQRATSVQAIPDSVETTVIYNSVVDEDDEDGDITMNTGTGVATINNAGWYHVEAGTWWETGSQVSSLNMIIRHNGTNQAQQQGRALSAAEGMSTSTIIKCAASDTIDVRVFTDKNDAADRDVQVDDRSFLTIVKLRAA